MLKKLFFTLILTLIFYVWADETTPPQNSESEEPSLSQGLESYDEPALPYGLASTNEPVLPCLPQDIDSYDELALPLGLSSAAESDSPNLPQGLEASQEPALPLGLSNSSEHSLHCLKDGLSAEPTLPLGLSNTNEPDLPLGFDGGVAREAKQSNTKSWLENLPFTVTGFAEARLGARTFDDDNQKELSLAEARFHVDAEKAWDWGIAGLGLDLQLDPILANYGVNLTTGEGLLDLRHANVVLRPLDYLDIKIGRQILTWGTGDFVFINDLFPKDWRAFLIGRDDTYLKAPTDGIKLSFFLGEVNFDIIYSPRFNSDRFITGERLSYFNASVNDIVGRNEIVSVDAREDWLSEFDIYARAYRTLGPFEVALYGYYGYWKSPAGQDISTGNFTFPSLSVYGASGRGPIAEGIGYVEAGYYDSRDDRAGDDPLVHNSEFRFLVGYEQEIAPNLTGGGQYYLEAMMNHGAYKANLPAGAQAQDQFRHTFTLRLTQMLLNQDLTLSLFTFFSPSDLDGYLRFKSSYRYDDMWRFEGGVNLFYGLDDNSFFGQFQTNSNVFVGLRYSF